MKKKSFNKLGLRKTTVTNLSITLASEVLGGIAPSALNCPSVPIVACSPWCAQTLQRDCPK
jgi:hypothetical protein